MKLKHVDYFSLLHAKNHSCFYMDRIQKELCLEIVPLLFYMKFSKGDWKWGGGEKLGKMRNPGVVEKGKY